MRLIDTTTELGVIPGVWLVFGLLRWLTGLSFVQAFVVSLVPGVLLGWVLGFLFGVGIESLVDWVQRERK